MTETNTVLLGNSDQHGATQYMCRLAPKIYYSSRLDNLWWKVQIGCALDDVCELLPLS
jgi:hypothetical protein